MSRSAYRFAAAAGWLVLAACTRIPLPGPADDAIERKTVVAKQAPDLLIAADGSRCRASAQKMKRTRRGDRIWCAWRKPAAERSLRYAPTASNARRT